MYYKCVKFHKNPISRLGVALTRYMDGRTDEWTDGQGDSYIPPQTLFAGGIIKQQWTIEEISIFRNSSHLEWRAGLSDTNLKGTHPGTIPARFGLIWFSNFRGKDLNVIFYQNMPNFHNRYKSAERNITRKNPDYMLNYSLRNRKCKYPQ